ncbi:MAG TPA: response regulator [Pyrinomonadaceae bacterium]|nr:response regulator [Pyrinomonadaceae bacterium]
MLRHRSQISKRVLIVVADPAMRALLGSAVTNEGYEAVIVRDGREAFRIFKTDADFSAALFDLSVPGLSGIELTRHMRTEKRLMRIPVMTITEQKGLKELSDSFAAGATAFLCKSFTEDQLQNALRILLSTATLTSIAA